MLAAQAADLIVHDSGLYRAATRGIHAQDDTGGSLVGKSRAQRLADALRAAFTATLDRAVHVDHRRVPAVAELLGATPVNQHQENGDQIGQPGKLEDSPAALRPLLLQRRKSDLFQQLSFPSGLVLWRIQGICSLLGRVGGAMPGAQRHAWRAVAVTAVTLPDASPWAAFRRPPECNIGLRAICPLIKGHRASAV